MTSIILDGQAGAMPLRQLFENPPDHEIEFWSAAGEFVGMLTIKPPEATKKEYAEFIARAEADIDELRRLAKTPRENCVTIDEHLARLKALSQE